MASEGSNLPQYHKETKPARGGSKRRGGGGGGGGGGVRLSTDPQSIASRERRHRISNRFKILQSMVPGGTKMDTVSMLEEAIHYVKFLKNQIIFHQSVISSPANDLPLQLQSPPSYSYLSPPDLPVTHLPTPLPAHDDYLLGEVNLPPLPPSCFHQGGEETQTICFPSHSL